jgi:hypothetical protein
MANCSIPSFKPANGRISTISSRQLRKRNDQQTTSVLVISRWDASVQKRVQGVELQSALRTRKIQSPVRDRQSAIWRVNGAWWPSRSSKPSSSRLAGRGRFDSYPLRFFIFDFRFSIADCHVATALRAMQQRHEGGEPHVT